jgi:hypothetical protein
MAFRIDSTIIRGEISNEVQGEVTGRLWLLGRKEPVALRLMGDCLRDLAGCRLTFENPHPLFEEGDERFADEQQGVVGDLTASKKTQIITVSESELMRRMEQRLSIPTRTANALYLEWFSEENGRVVIETTEFLLTLSEPMWTMTAAEEKKRLQHNQATFNAYVDEIIGLHVSDDEDEDDEDDIGDVFEEGDDEDGVDDQITTDEMQSLLVSDEPLDEFEWEQEFREADRHAEAYQEAWDRYQDHPNRDRLIAEALGMDPAATEAFRHEVGEYVGSEPEDLIEDATDFMAEPEERHHPLSRRAADFALRLQREAEAFGLMAKGSTMENALLAVVINIITLGGKLAAALDPMVQGGDAEPGFVIAMLKRAQVPLNEALHAISAVQSNRLTPEARLIVTTARHELFDLRKEILDIMQTIRRRK